MSNKKESKYTKKENEIMQLATDFCENHCSECYCCVEDECVLYRIQKIIEKEN